MKKNKIVNITILLLSFVLFLSVFVAFISASTTKADILDEMTYKLSSDIEKEYMRDTCFNVPTLTVQYDGNTYSSTYKLSYPDNRESRNNSNYLDVEGEYVLHYYFTVDGNLYSKEYSFEVFTGISSLFYSEKATFSVNSTPPSYMSLDKDYVGMKVSSNLNNTIIEYSLPIDLADNTKDDVLIEFLAIPSTINIPEISKFIVKLTDTENPDNWVKIRVGHAAIQDYFQVYCGANFRYGFAGYDPYNMIGYNPYNTYSGNGGLTAGFGLTNSSQKICSNAYGYAAGYNLSSVKLYFDYFERAIYAKPATLTNAVGDLDDVKQVGEGNQWNGFSSGKAYLSIETDLKSSQLNYLIINIDGQDMSQYKVKDTTAPEIRINLEGNTEEDLPYGLVGKPYNIFKAESVDNLDRVSFAPEIRVYDKASYKNLIVSNDQFIPQTAGEYVIEYRAKDSHGNSTVKYLTILVRDNYIEPITYSFNPDLKSNVLVGERFDVLDGVCSGGSGKLSYQYSLLRNDEVIEDDFITYKFNELGEFILRVVVTDYLGETKCFDKTITVQNNFKPMFEMPYINDYFIAGNTYYLPSVSAYEYSQDLNGEIVDVDVYADGVKLENNRFAPTEAGEVLVTYKAISKYDASEYSEFSKPVKIIKPAGSTFISDYFYCSDNVTKTVNDENIGFLMHSTELVSFINFLGVTGLSVDFNINAEKNNFDRVSFYLLDANDPLLKIKISVGKSDNVDSKTSKVWVNDAYVATISGSFFGKVINSFVINFKQAENGLSFYDGTTGSLVSVIDTTVFGKPFSGFISDSVYLQFELEGVTGDSEIILYSISNQMFNGRHITDRTAPNIVLNGEIETDKRVGLNDTVKIPSATAFDVLTVNPVLNLKIIDPDGIVLYQGSASDEYSFIVSKYGVYSIIYSAKDLSLRGNEAMLPYSCRVIDNITPTIEIDEKNIPVAVYQDIEYKLPTATITDNYSSNVFSSITIYCPNGNRIKITDNSFKLTEKGIHRLVYFACDEEGNSVIRTFIISAI